MRLVGKKHNLSRVFGTLKGTDEKNQFLDSYSVFIDFVTIDVISPRRSNPTNPLLSETVTITIFST